MREERERAQVKDAFGHYVSPALLKNWLKTLINYGLAAKRVILP